MRSLPIAARARILGCPAVLFLLLGSIGVVSVHGEDALLEAIRGKNLSAVSTLIRQKPDLNALRSQGWWSTTPLYEAAKSGSVDVVKVLLDAGAKVDVSVDEPETLMFARSWERSRERARLTPLGAAVLGGNQDIVRLLIARGAPVESGHLLLAVGAPMGALLKASASRQVTERYAAEKLMFPIVRGDAEAVRAALQEPEIAAALRGMAGGYQLLLAYTYGGPAFRDLVLAAGSPEVARGKINLLDQLLSSGFEIEEPGLTKALFDRRLRFPVATTVLADAKTPLRYAAERAFDGDLATSWVEGVDGPGLGQKLAFALPVGAAAISVVPGYGDETYYGLNNRVRTARLTLFDLGSAWGAPGNWIRVEASPAGSAELRFEDVLRPQRFELPAATRPANADLRIAVIEITDVYPGNRWDDTCIAEVVLYDASGAALRAPAGRLPAED